MTLVVGITGLIASGKSTMLSYLASKGYGIFEADQEVKNIYRDEIFLERLQQEFPKVFVEGKLQKPLMAEHIFSNPNGKQKLESLIHPRVFEARQNFIKEAKRKEEKIIFFDSPLLFELGLEKECDCVILVILPKDIQEKRYLERGGNPDLFEKIYTAQGTTMDHKLANSNYIIKNDSSLEDFQRKIDEVLAKLKERAVKA